MSELQLQLEAKGSVDASGAFEVLLITEGEAKGHGVTFPASVLKAAVNDRVFEGIECFVNHDYFGRDLRDLGGIFSGASWSEEDSGIAAKLRTIGPSGSLVAELGREMLSEEEPKPKVGFSVDVVITQDGEKNAAKILRAYSVDLVFDPARGGAFKRALNSVHPQKEDEHMEPKAQEEKATTPVKAQVEEDLNAVRSFLGAVEEKQALAEEAAQVRAVRAEVCGHLLKTSLAASGLPEASRKVVEKRFTGQVFEPADLEAAIEEQRDLVSELQASSTVQGAPGGMGRMFNSADQLEAAVCDMLGAPREKGLESVKVAKLSGIRELYLMLTGDSYFHGGYDPGRVQLNTGSFSNIVANVMNKAMLAHWDKLGAAGYDWWEKIVHVEQFSDLKQITWEIFGTIGSLPSITKGEEYTALMIGDGAETSDFTKYGGYVGIDLEDMINDDTRKLRSIPKELANAGIRNISALVAAVFTDNSGIGPTMADTGALFNATAVTTAGGHANLLTTALGTTYTAWDAVATAMYNQPMLIANETGYIGTGKKMAINPKFCLVPRALTGQADALFVPRWAANVESIASAGGPTYAGIVEPVTVPEWTDTNNFAAVADPLLVPGVCIGHAFGLRPEIFVAGNQLDPAVFMNDEARIKVRHWVAVGVADYRPLHKSNVA